MAKRKPGRQKKLVRVISPQDLLLINRMFLRNVPVRQIAQTFGCHHSTIQHHIETTIRPIWREVAGADKETQIAKINHLEMVAWEQFDRDAPAETSEQIKTGLIEGASGKRARMGIIERAIKTIKRQGQKAWLDVVQWCIAEKNRIEGHYRSADEFGDGELPQIVPIEVTTREDVAQLSRLRLSFNNGILEAKAVEQPPAHTNGNGNGHANGNHAEGDDDDDD